MKGSLATIIGGEKDRSRLGIMKFCWLAAGFQNTTTHLAQRTTPLQSPGAVQQSRDSRMPRGAQGWAFRGEHPRRDGGWARSSEIPTHILDGMGALEEPRRLPLDRSELIVGKFLLGK